MVLVRGRLAGAAKGHPAARGRQPRGPVKGIQRGTREPRHQSRGCSGALFSAPRGTLGGEGSTAILYSFLSRPAGNRASSSGASAPAGDLLATALGARPARCSGGRRPLIARCLLIPPETWGGFTRDSPRIGYSTCEAGRPLRALLASL